MPETITIDLAFKLSAMFLVSTWIGILVGFIMGKNGGRNGWRKAKERRFNPGSTEIDEKTPWDEALEGPETGEEQRFETLPAALQGGPQ